LAFVKVADISEIPIGNRKMVKLEGKEILLTNIGGTYYAVGNRCTHAGGDLSKGSLDGNIITCPRHGSKFDVTTGKVVSGPKILFLRPTINDEPSYEVKVDGREILLKIDK